MSYDKTAQNSFKSHILVLDIETTGLNAWYGDKVTCICAKTLDNSQSFRACVEDEPKLLILLEAGLNNLMKQLFWFMQMEKSLTYLFYVQDFL